MDSISAPPNMHNVYLHLEVLVFIQKWHLNTFRITWYVLLSFRIYKSETAGEERGVSLMRGLICVFYNADLKYTSCMMSVLSVHSGPQRFSLYSSNAICVRFSVLRWGQTWKKKSNMKSDFSWNLAVLQIHVEFGCIRQITADLQLFTQ